MTERSYEDAVQTLKRRLGGRWEGVEADGRDEIRQILREELGYDRATADDTFDAMVRSGELRYHRLAERRGDERDAERDVGGPFPTPMVGPGEGMATGVPASAGSGGMPLAPGIIATAGYWEIGRDGGESAPPGRAGQVQIDT